MSQTSSNARSNAIFLRDFLLIVDVDFGKGDLIRLRVFRREGLVGRCDCFAWSAPVCVDWDCFVSWEIGNEGERRGIQSAMTMVDEPSNLLNSAEDPILTEEGILGF